MIDTIFSFFREIINDLVESLRPPSREGLIAFGYRGCAVVEGVTFASLDCEVRGSNLCQGRNFKRDFCFISTTAVVKACHPCRVRPQDAAIAYIRPEYLSYLSQLRAFSACNFPDSHVLVGTRASISQFSPPGPSLTQFLDPPMLIRFSCSETGRELLQCDNYICAHIMPYFLAMETQWWLSGNIHKHKEQNNSGSTHAIAP